MLVLVACLLLCTRVCCEADGRGHSAQRTHSVQEQGNPVEPLPLLPHPLGFHHAVHWQVTPKLMAATIASTSQAANTTKTHESAPSPDTIRLDPRPTLMVPWTLLQRHDPSQPAHQLYLSPFQVDAGTCVLSDPNQHSLSTSETEPVVACLPSFVIIGAMKSGTAELQLWLSQHPHLHRWGGPWISGAGEAHFFDRVQSDTDLAQSWVQQYLLGGLVLDGPHHIRTTYTFEKTPRFGFLFPHRVLSAPFVNLKQKQNTGTPISHVPLPPFATPFSSYYFFFIHSLLVWGCSYIAMHEDQIRRMHHMLPSIKLVLLLRSPPQRTYSHFQHNCRKRRLVRVANATRVPPELRGRVVSLPLSVASGATQRREQAAHRFIQNAYSTRALEPQDVRLLMYPCSPADFDVFLKMGSSSGEYEPSMQVRMHKRNKMVLSRSLYADALARWLQIFPSHQLLVLLSEQLFSNMTQGVQRVEVGLLHSPPPFARQFAAISNAPWLQTSPLFLQL